MNDQEMEAYLNQMRAMGMDEDMIAAYRQQYEQSMKLVSQIHHLTLDELGISVKAMSMELADAIPLAEDTDLTVAQQWGIACGADLAFMNDDLLNTLGNSDNKEDAQRILSEWWGVDARDELIETFSYLKASGHRLRFTIVDTALRMTDTAEAKAYLQEHVDDFETAVDWFRNMRNAYEQFTEDGFLQECAALPNLLAWDYVRIINLCRNGIDAGYLNRPEALAIVMNVAKTLQENYSSWKDLSLCYQFGRYVWGGSDQYEILKSGMEKLLTDENSPWVKLDWHMKL